MARLDDERLGRRRPAPLPRGVELPARARRGHASRGRASWRWTGRSCRTTGSCSPPARGRRSRRSTGSTRVEYWTNREATRTHKVPQSLVVMGGGPVGAELAQFFSRMGSQVTIVERGEHLLGRVHADAGELIAEHFREEGIDVRLGVGIERRRARHRAPPVGRLDARDRAPARRDRAAAERRAARPRGARRRGRPRGIEVDERLRAGRERLGDRRRHRRRAVHPRRQVPGAHRRGGHGGPPAQGRLPRDSGRDLHRSGGRDRRPHRRRRPRDRARGARLPAAPGDVRAAEARRLRPRLRRPAAARPRGRRLRRAAGAEWLGQFTLAIRAEVPVETCSTRSSRTRPSPRASSTPCRSCRARSRRIRSRCSAMSSPRW